MMPSVGDVSVTFSPSVIGNIDGAMRYIRDYPYLCWEQRLTKALMAANYIQLQAYLGSDITWPDAKTLPQTFLNDASMFQAPNGGMDFWTSDDARVSPYLSADTALAFNRLRRAGYTVPDDVEKRLDSYLQAIAALEYGAHLLQRRNGFQRKGGRTTGPRRTAEGHAAGPAAL